MKLPKSFPPTSIIALFIIAALIYLFAGCSESNPVEPPVNIDLTGDWIFRFKFDQFVSEHEILISQQGDSISGRIDLVTKNLPITGMFVNNTLIFYYTLYQTHPRLLYVIVGIHRNDKITGTISINEDNVLIRRYAMEATKVH